MKEPTISVVIATYNAQKTIMQCLESIRMQNYDQKKISIILADGGSTDGTLDIVKKYRVKIIKVDPEKQNAEYNKAIGIGHARGMYLLQIDHDNVLPHKNWIQAMLKPLQADTSITASETLRYHYDPNGTLLDRYFALFGAGDPLAYYLGKADRMSYILDAYNLFGTPREYKDYYVVRFNTRDIPTLGANGFMIRRSTLIKHAQTDPDHYFHIDVNVDLIRKGFNRYAFIKDTIIHLTSYKSVWQFILRRKLFMEQFHMDQLDKRRYSVYMRHDFWRLIRFIIIAGTIVVPTMDAIRGYRRIHDPAWFVHPLLSFTLLAVYSYVILKRTLISYVT